MPEYIEREAAIQSAKHAWAKGLEPSQYIEIIPSAEVTNVIRCKDCKHYDGKWLCKICGVPSRKPYDFCSYGERKET